MESAVPLYKTARWTSVAHADVPSISSIPTLIQSLNSHDSETVLMAQHNLAELMGSAIAVGVSPIEYQEEIRNANGIVKVIRLLESNHPTICIFSALLLHMLMIDNDANKEEFWLSGGFSVLTSSLWLAGGKLRWMSLQVLQEILLNSSDSKYQQSFLAALGPSLLVELLRSEGNQGICKSALKMVQVLAESSDQIRSAFCEAGVLPILVAYLSGEGACKTIVATDATVEEEGQCATEAVEQFISHTYQMRAAPSVTDLIHDVLTTLYHLLCNNYHGSIIFKEAGGISVLMKMLQGYQTCIVPLVLALLSMISKNSQWVCEEICHDYGVRTLVRIVKYASKLPDIESDQPLAARRHVLSFRNNRARLLTEAEQFGLPALALLWQIVCGRPNELNTFRCEGGIPPLLMFARHMINSDTFSMNFFEIVCNFLMRFVSSRPCNQTVVRRAGGITVMIAILQSRKALAATERGNNLCIGAVGVLCNLCANNASNQEKVRCEKGIPLLAALLDRKLPTGAELNAENRRNRSHVSAPSSDEISNAAVVLMENVCKTLQNVVMDIQKNRRLARQLQVPQKLVRILQIASQYSPQSYNSKLSKFALSLLYLLLNDDPTSVIVGDLGGIPLILDMLRKADNDIMICDFAINCLSYLTQANATNRDRIRRANGIPLLAKFVSESYLQNLQMHGHHCAVDRDTGCFDSSSEDSTDFVVFYPVKDKPSSSFIVTKSLNSIQFHAIAIFSNLAINNSINQRIIITQHAEVLAEILNLTQAHQPMDMRLTAVNALFNLTSLTKPNVPSTSSLSSSLSLSSSAAAPHTIKSNSWRGGRRSCKTSWSPCSDVFQHIGVIATLLTLLMEDTTDDTIVLQLRALIVIGNIIQHGGSDIRDHVRNTGGLQLLMQTLKRLVEDHTAYKMDPIMTVHIAADFIDAVTASNASENDFDITSAANQRIELMDNTSKAKITDASQMKAATMEARRTAQLVKFCVIAIRVLMLLMEHNATNVRTLKELGTFDWLWCLYESLSNEIELQSVIIICLRMLVQS